MCLAVPGKIRSIEGEGAFRKGKVSFGGVLKEVSLAFVPEAGIGEYVIVHAGFAISQLDEEAASVTLDTLKEVTEIMNG